MTQNNHILLEDILAKEPKIFFDASMMSVHREIYHGNGHHTNQFKLDFSRLEESLDVVEKAIRILQNSNVYTVQESVEEMRYLNRLVKRNIADRRTVLRFNRNNGYTTKDILLEKMDEEISHAIHLASKSRIHNNNQDYYLMADIVNFLSEAGMLKKSTLNPSSTCNKTDETIVSYALYSSLVEKKQAAILTADSDLDRILSVSAKAITCAYMGDLSNKLIDRIVAAPINLYFSIDGHVREKSTETLKQSDTLKLYNMTNEQNQYILDSVKGYLHKINFQSSNADKADSN